MSFNDTRIKPGHGGCLTLWLVVSALAAIFVIVSLLGIRELAARRGVGPLVYILIAASVLHIVFVVGIFDWRKWGVYGIVAIVIISPILQIIAGIATTRDYIAPFVQLGLLYYLIHDKWDYYD